MSIISRDAVAPRRVAPLGRTASSDRLKRRAIGLFPLSAHRHEQLSRFRRRTWMAIAVCLALRLASTVVSQLGGQSHDPAAASNLQRTNTHQETLS